MSISIVIPCYNGAGVIGSQLHALAPQLDVGDEIIVADNRSTDDIRDVVDTLRAETRAPIRLVDAHDRQGINHARNAGVRAAHGDLILLCDADDLVPLNWVAVLGSALRAGADAVGGDASRVLVNGTELELVPGVYSVAWRRVGGEVTAAVGASCGFHRFVYDAVGGFDEQFVGGSDEIDFFYRASLAGFTVRRAEGAPIRYLQRTDLHSVFRQHATYGVGSVRLYKKLRPLGMPRDPWYKPALTVVHAAFAIAFGSAVQRRIGVERMSRRWGRIVGSIRFRVWYP